MSTVVAIDIGGTKIAGAIVRYGGAGQPPAIELRRQVPTAAHEGGDAVLERVVALVDELLGEFAATGADEVLGIGVSTAGSVDEKNGAIAFANDIMPGWMGQPVAARLSAAFGLPVAVLNDVHAHALGELRHGAARGAQTAIVVAAGTGLGGAVIVNGQVLGGAHGFAGMLGHTLHHSAEGLRCACGVEGHLECVASGSGIEACYLRGLALQDEGRPDDPGTETGDLPQHAGAAHLAPAEAAGDRLPARCPDAAHPVWDCTPLPGGNPVSGARIAQLADEGDRLARSVIETAGRSLGEAIASWAGIVDPEVAVVSGSVTKAGPLWRDALESGFADRLGPEFRGRLPIVDALLGDDAPLVGAAERLRDVL